MLIGEKAAAIGNSISLTNWEGSATGSVSGNSTTTHTITTNIPAKKIVVVSLDSTALSDPSGVRINLLDSSGRAVTKNVSWHPYTCMTFFKTTASTQQYRVQIVSNMTFSYGIKVAVVNAMEFVPCDCLGYAETEYADSTYMISDSPESLSGACRAEDGKFLARGRLKGKCRLYWEHYNNLGSTMKFGVLLWNTGSTTIYVSLTSRSVKDGPTYYEAASLGVWVDCLNDVKQADLSELPTNGVLAIPGGEKKWVALSTVPCAGSNHTGFFNGQLTLNITTTASASGPRYTGNALLCDTYIMGTGYDSQVKARTGNMVAALESGQLRGSGTGALLYSSIPELPVAAGNPYDIVITGTDIPNLQNGEKISLKTYSPSGAATTLTDNCFNYGVMYRFVIGKITCNTSNRVTVKLLMNAKTNPNCAVDRWAGVYAIGTITTASGNQVFSKLLYCSADSSQDRNEYVISTQVPTNQQVILNVVISGMSSMPPEISFCV